MQAESAILFISSRYFTRITRGVYGDYRSLGSTNTLLWTMTNLVRWFTYQTWWYCIVNWVVYLSKMVISHSHIKMVIYLLCGLSEAICVFFLGWGAFGSQNPRNTWTWWPRPTPLVAPSHAKAPDSSRSTPGRSAGVKVLAFAGTWTVPETGVCHTTCFFGHRLDYMIEHDKKWRSIQVNQHAKRIILDCLHRFPNKCRWANVSNIRDWEKTTSAYGIFSAAMKCVIFC